MGLFVDDVDGFLTDHEKSEFSLLDSGQELHIHDEIFFDDVVLLAELEETLDGVLLDVVIDGLSASDPGVQGQSSSADSDRGVLELNSPDSLSCGPTVLLQNSLTLGE